MKKQEFELVLVPYEQIPWYRRRWFVILSFFFLSPATLLIALTGDLFLKKRDGKVYKFPSFMRIFIIVMSLFWLIRGWLSFIAQR